MCLLTGQVSGSGTSIACNAPLFTLTDSITQSSVRLNWTDFNDEVLGWEIEWGLQGFARTGTPNSGLITSTGFILNELEAGTSYDIYIRSKCSEAESSNWNGPFKINTAIDNSEACQLGLDIRDNNCPRLEDFYINVEDVGGALGSDVFIQSVDIIIQHDWPADLQLYLVSPSGRRILLSRNRGIGLDNYGNPSDSTCTEVCSFSDFACIPISDVGTQQIIGSFLPEENISDLYDNSPADGLWKLSMCDRALEDRGILRYASINFAPVICNVPTGIVATEISDSTAVIQWNPPDNCNVAIINVVFSGEAPGTNIEIFTSCQSGQFKVSGLLPETAYDIYIRSDCNSSKSAFSCPASFVTACNIVTLSSSFESDALCVESCNASCPLSTIWQNLSGDQQDWLVHSGPTATENTGPDGDISGIGNYIYIENTLDLCGASNKAILEATCIEVYDNPGPCDMSFYYHMYGEHIDSLSLIVSRDNGASWQKLFESKGDSGKAWRRAFIDLADYSGEYCTFRFIGISGTEDRADIALDQIEFYGSNLLSPLPIFYFDNDGDGYGGVDSVITLCVNNPPDNYTAEPLDCDDNNILINPGALEIQCNLIDENCNGNVDDAEETNPILYDIATIVNESCPGASDASIEIQVSGGNPPYEVLWNNGSRGNSVTGLKEDIYFATITDAGTCTIVTEFIDIDVISAPQIFFVDSQPSRCNDSTGIIDIEIAGGLAPYQYKWNNGRNTQDLLNIPEGVYTVTATDQNGCDVSMDGVRIISSPRFTAGIQSQRNLTCFGDSSGTISIGIFNAVEPITYSWSNGDTTSNVSDLSAGIYSVTINDARGCEEIIAASITSPEKLESEVIGIEQVTCFNGSNGGIEVRTNGGTFPYNFEWISDPELSFSKSKQEDIDNLLPGTYQLMVSDGKGCTDTTRTITLTNPDDIEIFTDSVFNVRCKLSADGYLSVDVNGGAGDYSYFWGFQEANQNFIENIPSGTYSLTVIDKFGCKKTVNDLTVNNRNIPLDIQVAVITDNICSYDSLGQMRAEVLNGIPPLDFNWSSGRQRILARPYDTVKMLPGGSYAVTITDSEGCVGFSDPASINDADEVRIDDIMIILNECNSDMQGQISIAVSGGMTPYSLMWSNGNSSQFLTNLPDGTYDLTVTDNLGCVFEFDPIILSSTDPIISGAEVTAISGGMENGSISLDISGGDPPYQINWDNLAVDETSHTDLPAGTYCATITDDKGCFLAECYNIDQSDSSYDHKHGSINIYPNPVQNILKFKSEKTVSSISILRLDGKLQRSVSVYSNDFDLSLEDLQSGVYVLRIEIEDDIYYKKIVKTD